MVEVRICDLAQLKKEEFQMAWYAELQRIKWHCIKGFDAIRFYKKYQYAVGAFNILRKYCSSKSIKQQFSTKGLQNTEIIKLK